MRRFLGLGFGALFLLSGCESHPSSSILPPSDEEGAPQEESDSQIPGQEDPFQDGAGISADNPHFFFLSPLVEGASYSGVAEGGLDVEVAICPRGSWDDDREACLPGEEVAVFDTQGGDPGDRVLETLDSEYRVVWDTQSHPAQAGQIYRIVVSVMGQAMGWVDVLAFEDAKSCENGGRGERGCEALPYDPLRGYAAFPYLGTLKIAFRVEEGGVESEFCDSEGVEDCDVEIFTYDRGGCLRVYENPGESGEMLGSQACLPSGAAELDGEPVQGTYAVILTLEKDEAHQGNGDGFGQVPFFPDLRTDPPGISFNPESEGITVVICQATEGDGAVPEDLHPFLRPFLIFSDGSVSLPDEFTPGAPECEGVGGHLHADGGADTGAGWLGRITRGLSRISKAFLPSPLHAFRLHGGLNTTVYETKTARRGGGGDASSPHGTLGGLPTPGEEETFFVELGAFLDVDPLASGAAVPASVVLGGDVSIVIDVLDVAGGPLPFEVPVTVEVSGANPGTLTAELVALGQYVAAYTPEALGTDQISILAEGRSLPGPYSVVKPLGPW